MIIFGQPLEDDAFSCMEPDYCDIVCTLIPGQFLACGMGPNGYVCLSVSPKELAQMGARGRRNIGSFEG